MTRCRWRQWDMWPGFLWSLQTSDLQQPGNEWRAWRDVVVNEWRKNSSRYSRTPTPECWCHLSTNCPSLALAVTAVYHSHSTVLSHPTPTPQQHQTLLRIIIIVTCYFLSSNLFSRISRACKAIMYINIVLYLLTYWHTFTSRRVEARYMY